MEDNKTKTDGDGGSYRTHDNVNHPNHYTWLKKLCGIEPIDITRHLDFNLGNAIKYVLRAGKKKDPTMSDYEKTVEDLQKAVFYLNDEIKMLRLKQTMSNE